MPLIESLLDDFHVLLAETKNSTPRRFAFPDATKMIKVTIGMRRSGKTFFYFNTSINYLLSSI